MICEYSSHANHQMSPIKTTTTRQKRMKTRIYLGFMSDTQTWLNHFLLRIHRLHLSFWKCCPCCPPSIGFEHRVTQTNKRTKGRRPPAPQGASSAKKTWKPNILMTCEFAVESPWVEGFKHLHSSTKMLYQMTNIPQKCTKMAMNKLGLLKIYSLYW